MKYYYFSFYFLILVYCSLIYSSTYIFAQANFNGYRVVSSGIIPEDNDGTINYTPTIYRSILPLKVSSSQGLVRICTGVAVSDNVVLTAPLCVPTNDPSLVQVIKTSDNLAPLSYINPEKIYRNSLYKSGSIANALVALVFKEGSFSDFIEVASGFLDTYLTTEDKEYNFTYIGFSNSTSPYNLSLKIKKATISKINDNSFMVPVHTGFLSLKNGINTIQKFFAEQADIGSPLLFNGKVVGITADIIQDKTQHISYPVWSYINSYSNPYKNNNYNFLFLELHNLASIAGITPGIKMVEFWGMVKILDLNPRYSYGISSECDNCNLKVNDTITGINSTNGSGKRIYFIPPKMNYKNYINFVAQQPHLDIIDLSNPEVIYKSGVFPIKLIRYIWKISTQKERKNLPWILNRSSYSELKSNSIFKESSEHKGTRLEYYEDIEAPDYFKYLWDINSKTNKNLQKDIISNNTGVGRVFLGMFANDDLKLESDCKILSSVDSNDVFYSRLTPVLEDICKSQKYTPIQCRLKKGNKIAEYVTNTTSNGTEFNSNNIDLVFLTCSDDIKKINTNNQSTIECDFETESSGKLHPGVFLHENFGRFRCHGNLVPSIFINQVIDF